MTKLLSFFTVGMILLTGCEDRFSSHTIRNNGLIYCGTNHPNTFNPQLTDGGMITDSFSSQVFERLIQIDENDYSLKPMLATHWEISEDRKQYDFYLRTDVSFHSNAYFSPNRKLTADDVVFSFDRIINPKNPFHSNNIEGYPWFESMGFSNLIEDVYAIDSHIVRFSLKKTDASFLSSLATAFSVIHSKEYSDILLKDGTTWRMDSDPIGTGAFYFSEFVPNQYVRLKKFDEYWNGEAKLNQVVYDVSRRGIGQLSKLVAKECDILSTPNARELEYIKTNPRFHLTKKSELNVAFLSLNTKNPYLTKPSIRQAINFAINKKAIIDGIYSGSGKVAANLLPNSSWAQNENIATEYNPALAKSLLAQAGYLNGFEIDLLVSDKPRPYNPNPLKMAQYISDYLSKINIKVNIVVKDNFSTELLSQEFYNVGMLLTGWIADNADPDNFFRPNLSCAGIPTGLNLTNWCDSEFENLLNQAVTISDRKERKFYYGHLLRRLDELMPIIPISHGIYHQVITNDIIGYNTTPFGDKSFVNVTRKQ